MRKSIVILTTLMLIIGMIVGSSGVLAKKSGEEIIKKVDETLTSKTRDSKIKMTIVNENGQKRNRTIKIMSKGENKGLVEFVEPADVEGTAFLTVDKKGKENMWLYLPAVGSVRKVASHMRNGSFMGTDFTYNDISMIGGSDYTDKYDSELLGEEKVNGKKCYVLESTPTEDDIDYSKMKMWVRKNDYMPLKMEFYDQDKKLLKVMTNKNITNIDGHITPKKITMKNQQKGTKTILNLEKIEFNIEIPQRVFTTRYMKR